MPFTPARLVGDPLFGEALRQAALHMVAIHDAAPRIVRYTASLRKWLLTQAILTLHFERLTDPSRPELTAARLIDFIAGNNVASKNTAAAHLAEMRNYRLLLDAEQGGDKRIRPLILSDVAEGLIRQWFEGHLSSLDRLDEGTRLAQSQTEPTLMHHALPRAMRRLIADRAWCEPPESIAAFVSTESGSNILHDLVARLPTGVLPDQRIWIGPLKPGEISSRYIISRTHAQRFSRVPVISAFSAGRVPAAAVRSGFRVTWSTITAIGKRSSLPHSMKPSPGQRCRQGERRARPERVQIAACDACRSAVAFSRC